MSQYATLAQLDEAGLPATALASIGSPARTAALVKASGVADGYLRKRFALPLSAWSDDLTQVVCEIAAYNLMSVRGFNPASNADTLLAQRYQDAIAWLKDVARGLVEPDLTDATPTVDEAGPLVESDDALFVVGNGYWGSSTDESC